MELLPIIYWTLVGIGILALIVIISSYISFYLRKKMGHIPTTEVTGDARDKKVKVTNPDKRPEQKKSHHPKVQTRSKLKDNETKEKKRTTSSNEKSSNKLYKRPTQDDQKSRIEILNAPKEELKYYSMETDSKRKKWD
ncbi:MAG: hypothetical protein KAI45_07075 [Melioribacteraceae bacterium]|nr:hypothetical protein [Melioribacteraceae bacterium]